MLSAAGDRVGSRLVREVKRVCLLGAESTGKSTLARALATRYGTLWNPEYGRPYTQIGRPPRGAVDQLGVHAHRADPLLVRGLPRNAGASRPLCDTDAFTTAVFHEVYLGTPATGFEDLVDRPYDLFVVCGLDVPWRHDGIREFDEQRRWMQERYLERARTSGCRWVVVEGPLERRVEDAAGAVDEVLAVDVALD